MKNKEYIEKKLKFYWKYTERPKRIIISRLRRIFKITNEWSIQRQVNKHRNEIVYDTPFNIYRLLGWTKTFENERDEQGRYFGDWYYVLQRKSWNLKESIIFHSCVGGFLFIKNKLNKYEYYNMEHQWNMNCCNLEDVLEEVKAKKVELL